MRHQPACAGLRSEVVISSAAVYAKLTLDGSKVSMRTFGICRHGSVGRAALRGTLSSKGRFCQIPCYDSSMKDFCMDLALDAVSNSLCLA